MGVEGDFQASEVNAIFDLLDRDRDGLVSVETAAEWWARGARESKSN